MKTPSWQILMLVIGAFFAPILGGQLSVEPLPLAEGFATLILSLTGPESATLAHSLIALCFGVPLSAGLFGRKVMQLPQPRVTLFAILFGAMLMLSVGGSAYKFNSLHAFAEWAFYVVAFFAVIGLAGRQDGPKWLLGAFFGGCVLVAVIGAREYASAGDPSWRIFSTWFQPNALAGILMMGFLVGVGLTAITKERIHTLLAALATALVGFALVLTQSKAGYIALAFGTLVLFISWLFIPREAGDRPPLMKMAAPVLLVALLFVAFQLSPRFRSAQDGGPPQPAALSRVTDASGSQQQSVAFRMQLFKGAVQLAKAQPAGYGIGTYRFHSARTGLNTGTIYTHNIYLQLLTEASIVGVLLFVGLLVLCVFEFWRGSRNLPTERNVLRISIFAALAASLAHNLFDSDLSHFGIGISFFMLLGIGLQLSADASVPEYLPKVLRSFGGIAIALLTLFMFYFAWVDINLNRGYDAVGRGDQEAAKSHIETAQNLAGGDYRTWLLTYRGGGAIGLDANGAKDVLQRSISAGPTLRAHRAMAALLEQQDQTAAAISQLSMALKLDPNNLLTLKQLMTLQTKVDPESAKQTAQKLISIEGTPYYTIRAIPEIVPTETFEARLLLASHTNDQTEKVRLLKEAADGYLRFATSTTPMVARNAAYGLNEIGGQSVESSTASLQTATAAVQELREIYRAAGDPAGVAFSDSALETFAAALASLSPPSK